MGFGGAAFLVRCFEISTLVPGFLVGRFGAFTILKLEDELPDSDSAPVRKDHGIPAMVTKGRLHFGSKTGSSFGLAGVCHRMPENQSP